MRSHIYQSKELAVPSHPSAVEGRPVSARMSAWSFLGDSILGAIIATELFERYPDMDEGKSLLRLKISQYPAIRSIVSDALRNFSLNCYGNFRGKARESVA